MSRRTTILASTHFKARCQSNRSQLKKNNVRNPREHEVISQQSNDNSLKQLTLNEKRIIVLYTHDNLLDQRVRYR